MSAYDYRDEYDGYRDSRTYDADAARARLAARQARAGRAVDDRRPYRQGAPNPQRGGYGGRGGSGGPGNGFDLGVWLPRIGIVVGALLVLFILVNLVQCVGGAISGGEAEVQATESTATVEGSEATESGSESASESSSAASTEGVESPWTASGRFSTGDSTLDGYIKQFCDDNSTQGASAAENAFNVNCIVQQSDYVERENNQSPWGEQWDIEMAKQWFESGNSGNCYNFASMTEYILKYFGYEDAEAEPCVVHLQSGDWGDHGLVFVTNIENGKASMVDDALGTNGWMLDADSYEFDVRNIAQNSTIKGNVSVLDNAEPSPIPPGNLTE